MITDVDETPRYRRWRWQRVVAIIVLVSFASLYGFLACFTDIFTRGRIGDLAHSEHEVLLQIESMGIQVRESHLSFFGAPDHVIIQVHWERSLVSYVVSAIEIRTKAADELFPYIRQLKYIRDIRVPLESRDRVETIHEKFPSAKVSRLPLKSPY